jgi:hypothetical protein
MEELIGAFDQMRVNDVDLLRTKLSDMKVVELKSFARDNKIKGYSKFTKKQDLINYIYNYINSGSVVTSSVIDNPFFELTDKQVFDILLNDEEYNKLDNKEIEQLDQRVEKIKEIPEELDKNVLLDIVKGPVHKIKDKNSMYLDDEIDNAIRPRGQFIPNPPNLNPFSPEYHAQRQRWIIDNDVIVGGLPVNGQAELNKKQKYKNTLLSSINTSKHVVPKDLRKVIDNLDCNNELDPITLEDITKKNWLEFKWIIVLDESGKFGDCFNKEDLIEGMLSNITFATYPLRNLIYYKEPLKGVWIDSEGLETIPESKIVQLVYKGKAKVGTRFGVSRTHGENENVYTFRKLY